MPRAANTPSKKSRSSSSARTRSRFSLPSFPLRVWLARLRTVAIVLALVGAISALPAGLVRKLPDSLQQVVAIAVDIRDLAGELARITTSIFGQSPLEWLRGLALDLDSGRRDVPDRPVSGLSGLPKVADSFSSAKAVLYEQIYEDHRETIYCGCRYDTRGQVRLGSCGLQGVTDPRARRVEAEHVFPAAQFGKIRQCWREPAAFPKCTSSSGRTLSGRECCERVDTVFATAFRDLHNLYPANGYINGQRSDYNWGMVSGGERFGDCEIRIDASQRRVQPPTARRGEIARTMLYMRDTYRFRLSRQDVQLYAAWNNADPPDAWEVERDKRIKRVQGSGNKYVEEYRQL
jgi:deoxyribonuclease I